jgi:DNA-binding CsgD family transcriptional regulator
MRDGTQNAVSSVPIKQADFGFLLLDPSQKLIFANEEVVRILSYPNGKPRLGSAGYVDKLVRDKICPILRREDSSWQFPLINEFQSGRRRYLCRVFGVTPRAGNLAQQEDIALLFERALASSVDFGKIREKYDLTEREQETLQHLIRGFTNKEIASRMQISPRTVKAFLRLVMIKMGVSNRAAVMGKVIEFRR